MKANEGTWGWVTKSCLSLCDVAVEICKILLMCALNQILRKSKVLGDHVFDVSATSVQLRYIMTLAGYSTVLEKVSAEKD